MSSGYSQCSAPALSEYVYFNHALSAGTEGIAARHQAPESKQPRRPIPVLRLRIPVESTPSDFVFPSARCIPQETPQLERLAHD